MRDVKNEVVFEKELINIETIKVAQVFNFPFFNVGSKMDLAAGTRSM